MTLDVSMLVQILVGLAAFAGAYAAIRSDIAKLHARVEIALRASDQANARIDAMLSAKQR